MTCTVTCGSGAPTGMNRTPTERSQTHLRVGGGPFRVARGGCYNEPAAECRSALRQGSPEERRDCCMGFRLARSLPSAGTGASTTDELKGTSQAP